MKNLMEYSTKDFYLSACLLASETPLLRLDPVNSGRSFAFVFAISPDQAEKLIDDHWHRRLAIPTKDFVEAINELKTRLYNRS